jgi:hypothetical protein
VRKCKRVQALHSRKGAFSKKSKIEKIRKKHEQLKIMMKIREKCALFQGPTRKRKGLKNV